MSDSISPTQKEIVYRIVKECQPLRTEQVKILAMKEGVSCADRFLRWLVQEDMVVSCKVARDRTKTWRVK